MTVRGFRGQTLLDDRSRVTESDGVAERRSEQIAMLLEGLGVDAGLDISFATSPEPADGIDDWMSRRVDVLVEP